MRPSESSDCSTPEGCVDARPYLKTLDQKEVEAGQAFIMEIFTALASASTKITERNPGMPQAVVVHWLLQGTAMNCVSNLARTTQQDHAYVLDHLQDMLDHGAKVGTTFEVSLAPGKESGN